MKVRDKVVVITGASSGIGAELATQLSVRGARLMLAARRQEALKRVADACSGDVDVCPTDVANPDDCGRLVHQTIERFGQLDILVNNAGISMWARFDEITDPEVFERLIRVNYLGTVYCTWYALPYLKKTAGLIVGVSSLTGKTGVPTRSAYAASKHAMQGFLDSIRVELRPSGVDVLVVSPGFVDTPIRQRALGSDATQIGIAGGYGAEKAMPVEKCVRLIVRAIEKRKRELLMTARAKLGMWIKLIAPSLVDRTAERDTRRFAPRDAG